MFKLEIFEGPLDLLLMLLKKNKVDVYDIPISLILEQYLDYLNAASELSLEISGEFVEMASRLIYIKSRMLLPKSEEDEEDPRAGLVNALIEYQKIKNAAALLNEQYSVYSHRFTRPVTEIKPDKKHTSPMDIALLGDAFEHVLKLNRRRLPPSIKSFTGIVGTKIIPVSQKIVTVLRLMLKKRTVKLNEAFCGISSRNELVATFMAILELAKTNRLIISGDGDGTTLSLIRSKPEDFSERTAEITNE